MAIGKTEFIENLYKDCYIFEYDKTYMYQARGDYDNKRTTHLVITNYPLEETIKESTDAVEVKLDMKEIKNIIETTVAKVVEDTVTKLLEKNIEKYMFSAIEKAFNIKLNINQPQKTTLVEQPEQEAAKPIPEKPKRRSRKKYKIEQCSKDGKTIKIYDSYEELIKEHKISKNSLAQCFSGTIKTSHGFVWKKINSPS